MNYHFFVLLLISIAASAADTGNSISSVLSEESLMRQLYFKSCKKNGSSYSENMLFGSTLGNLLKTKNENDHPYIIFYLLPEDLQKRILASLYIVSQTALEKFYILGMGQSFEHYAKCPYQGIQIGYDLCFILNSEKQIHFMEEITNKTNPVKLSSSVVCKLPVKLYTSDDYKKMMSLEIVVVETKTKPLQRLCCLGFKYPTIVSTEYSTTLYNWAHGIKKFVRKSKRSDRSSNPYSIW